MAHAVSKNTEQLLQSIETDEMRLSILKAQYYDYAAKWQIELLFGNSVKSIFEEYAKQYYTNNGNLLIPGAYKTNEGIKQYYEENGHLLIPDKYVTAENIKLGRCQLLSYEW